MVVSVALYCPAMAREFLIAANIVALYASVVNQFDAYWIRDLLVVFAILQV